MTKYSKRKLREKNQNANSKLVRLNRRRRFSKTPSKT